MRKALSGDRDAAAEYLGLAQARLADLKQVMALGGLQQLLRTITLPGGVELTVASQFGQDYVSIHVPVGIPTADAAETTTDVYDPARIRQYLTARYTDTVQSGGAVALTITRPRLIVVGACFGDVARAFWWRADEGVMHLLPWVDPSNHYMSECYGVSPDGNYLVGVETSNGSLDHARSWIYHIPSGAMHFIAGSEAVGGYWNAPFNFAYRVDNTGTAWGVRRVAGNATYTTVTKYRDKTYTTSGYWAMDSGGIGIAPQRYWVPPTTYTVSEAYQEQVLVAAGVTVASSWVAAYNGAMQDIAGNTITIDSLDNTSYGSNGVIAIRPWATPTSMNGASVSPRGYTLNGTFTALPGYPGFSAADHTVCLALAYFSPPATTLTYPA